MLKGNIINITRFCTDDGPGIRTTVFLKGCPLKCIWCHNPESQISEPEIYQRGETVGLTITADEVLDEAKKDKVFYSTSGGGVTVSGGEPLFQPDFTGEILRLCQEEGIHTAIETSGFASESSLEKVLPFCNLVLFDIKETDPEKHLLYTGVPLEPILKNLTIIDSMGIQTRLRLPIIPSLNDREEHFKAALKIAQGLKHCAGAEVMPYHKLGEYKYEQLGREYTISHIKEPSEETVKAWRGMLSLN